MSEMHYAGIHYTGIHFLTIVRKEDTTVRVSRTIELWESSRSKSNITVIVFKDRKLPTETNLTRDNGNGVPMDIRY